MNRHKHDVTMEAIDSLFEPEDLIELRTVGGRRFRQRFAKADQLDPELDQFTALNAAGGHVYFGANPRLRESGRTEDVALARSVFVDFDHVTPAEAGHRVASAMLPDPTLVVASGGGVHCYWRLVEPLEDLAEWRRYQKGLIRQLGSDPAIHDPPRVMRLPGFVNPKYDPPAHVEILECWPLNTYELDEFEPVEDAINAEYTDTLGAVAGLGAKLPPGERTLDFLTYSAPDGKRNTALYASARDLAGRGWTFEQAAEALMPPYMKPEPIVERWERGLDAIRRAFTSPDPTPLVSDAESDAMTKELANRFGGGR